MMKYCDKFYQTNSIQYMYAVSLKSDGSRQGVSALSLVQPVESTKAVSHQNEIAWFVTEA